MSVKILGGLARGFNLATPRSSDTRPTSALMRRKLFDWRQHLQGYRFIDLCAGSGAMGFEALSRGADEIYLVESSRAAVNTLKDNKEAFQKSFTSSSLVNIFSMDAQKWLNQSMSFDLSQDPATILFIDPPYQDHKLYLSILQTLKTKEFKGEIWIEGDKLEKHCQELASYLELIKTVEQGDHFVLVGNLV